MINSKKITIIISFLLLLSCGYKPIFSSSKASFSITEIKLFGKKNIGSKIKKNLNIYKNAENKSIFYSLKINSDQKKSVVSKDEKGDPKTFNLTVSVEILVKENNKNFNKKFNKNFSYKNNYNAFGLKNYENSISNDLTDNIIVEINDYLLTLPE